MPNDVRNQLFISTTGEAFFAKEGKVPEKSQVIDLDNLKNLRVKEISVKISDSSKVKSYFKLLKKNQLHEYEGFWGFFCKTWSYIYHALFFGEWITAADRIENLSKHIKIIQTPNNPSKQTVKDESNSNASSAEPPPKNKIDLIDVLKPQNVQPEYHLEWQIVPYFDLKKYYDELLIIEERKVENISPTSSELSLFVESENKTGWLKWGWKGFTTAATYTAYGAVTAANYVKDYVNSIDPEDTKMDIFD